MTLRTTVVQNVTATKYCLVFDCIKVKALVPEFNLTSRVTIQLSWELLGLGPECGKQDVKLCKYIICCVQNLRTCRSLDVYLQDVFAFVSVYMFCIYSVML